MRRGITLIELLFVMMILGILVAISLGFYSGTAALARVERTRAIIVKIDQLVTAKYESYLTRAVPIKVPMTINGQPTNPLLAARFRLNAMRELQRCEMPDRITDVQVNPAIIRPPTLQKNYRRRASAGWTTQHEGAECLYMILAAMRDGEDSALSFLAPSEVGDVDGDGMPEVWDANGRPIEFLRWAPGYSENLGADGKWGVGNTDDDSDGKTDNPKEFLASGSDDNYGPVTAQTRDYDKAPDQFDPLHGDLRWADADLNFNPYSLRPLIFSPGTDKDYAINVDPLPGGNSLSYQTTTPPNDPYVGWDGSSAMIGAPTGPGSADNITNHDLRG